MQKSRSRRRAETERVIEKRLKEIKGLPTCNSPGSNGKSYYDYCAEKPHKFHKRHPLDCGKAKCPICHTNKVWGKGEDKFRARDKRKMTLDNGDKD